MTDRQPSRMPLKVLAERTVREGRYALLLLCFERACEPMLYAEQNGDAACAMLCGLSDEEALMLFERVAAGALSPVQLADVAADAVREAMPVS